MSETDRRKSLIIGLTQVDDADDDEYNAWYETEHLPMISSLPGSLRMRRYQRTDQPDPKYLILMEFDGIEPIDTPGYHAKFAHGSYPAGTPWTKRMREKFDVKVRNVYLSAASWRGSLDSDTKERSVLLEMFDLPGVEEKDIGDVLTRSDLIKKMPEPTDLAVELFQALPEFSPKYLSVCETASRLISPEFSIFDSVRHSPDYFRATYRFLSEHPA